MPKITPKKKAPAKKAVPVKKKAAPAKKAVKVVKPAPKKSGKIPAGKKKAPAPVKTAKRKSSNAKKPSAKKNITELEKKLGKKLGNKKAAPLTRAQKLNKADNKIARRGKATKMPKKAIIAPENLKQKFLDENESKELKAVEFAIKRRLQRVVDFARTFEGQNAEAINKIIQNIVGKSPNIDQIGIFESQRAAKADKKYLGVDNEDGSEVDSHVANQTVTAAKRLAPGQVNKDGFNAGDIKYLNLSAGSKAVYTEQLDITKHMFGGKERGVVMFSHVGNVQNTTYMDSSTGKMKHSYYGIALDDNINEAFVSSTWQDILNGIAKATKLSFLPKIGSKHVFNMHTLNTLTRGQREFGFFGKNNGSRNAFFGKVENDVIYGCYVSVIPANPGTGDATTARPGGILFGYWCGVGVTFNELKLLTLGGYNDTIEGKNADPRAGLVIGQSILTQFFNSRNRALQLSVADISLSRSHGSDTESGDYIAKSDNGAIIYIPNTDLRNRFDQWNSDRTLPDELRKEEIVPGTDLTEFEYFAGRVIYTDMENKLMFYYSKGGELRKYSFSTSSKLNVRDMAELTKQKSFDPEYIKENRDTQSFYGTSFLLSEYEYGKAVGYDTARQTYDRLNDLKFDGYRVDESGEQEATFKRQQERRALLTIEGLRDSFNGDRKIFDILEMYYDELKLGAAYYYSQGHRDVIPKEVESEEDEESWGNFKDYELRRAPQIGMMLSIARKPYKEWAHENDLRANAKEIMRKMTSPSREDLDAVIGSFDGLVPDSNGLYPRLMPHQVETLAIMRNTNTAALDVDMGGGKTVMTVLDMTRLLRDGITTDDGSRVPCRPLVVMPGSTLVRNYIDDVQKFFGKNVNIFVLETNLTVDNKFTSSEIVERMQNAPANTIFVTTYSWLTSGKPYDVTLHMESRNVKRGKGKNATVVKELRAVTKKVFPRIELIINKIPITAVYLDESHKIKAGTSSQNKAAIALSHIPVRRILTGTMVSKDATDIFQQMRFLDSTLIGSEARFIAQYGAEDDVDENGKVIKAKRGQLRPGAEKEARAEIRANGVLQLRRSSWLPLLPDKEEKFHFVSMSAEHEAIYKAMLMRVVNNLDEALAKGLITQEQYNILMKLNTIFGTDDKSSDNMDDDDNSLTGRAAGILGDEEDDGEDDDKKKGQSQKERMESVQKNMAILIAAMQDFLSAPELLDPSTFNNDPNVIEAMRNAGLLDEAGKTVGLAIGPKDELLKQIITKHFASIGGHYIKRSIQEKKFGSDKSKYAGKIIIFHENVNAAIHFFNILRKSGFKGCGLYVKDKSLYGKSQEDLKAFKDREDDSVSILCAAEKSLLLGQNMQAANRVIRCSTPWTTGDYDQSLARAFRNGQDLKVYADNVQVDGTFEVLKLVKLFVRESSNRKLNSDFDVPFELSAKFAECNIQNHVDFATQKALSSFPVNRYVNPKNPNKGMYEDNANLFVELHDEIWKQEKLAAYGPNEALARAKDPKYLSDPRNNCEAARYYRMGLDTMSEMATGNQEIYPMAAEVIPKRADGTPAKHGALSADGFDAYFNGFIHPDDHPHFKAAKHLEARNRARSGDPGIQLREVIEECFDAMVATKPNYEKMYGKRRDEMIEELYADFTNLIATKSKDFNLFIYVGPHDVFVKGIYNMVVSKYARLGLAALNTGKSADIKMNVRVARKNAEILAGQINDFRRVNGLNDEMIEDDEDYESDEESNDSDDSSDDEEQEEETVEERETLVLGLSKYFSDASENATDDDAKLMLFAPISGSNTLANKLPKFTLPSGKKFEKRVRYVYTRSALTNAIQIKAVLSKIEANGGNIEAKDEKGKYELLDSAILRQLMSSKAPSTKQADNEHSIHTIVRDKNNVVSAKVAAKSKNQNIDCGFLVLDGRITLVAFPDADKATFNAKEEAVLVKTGFKKIIYMVVTYNVTEAQKTKLHRDLIALATKFNGNGVEFHNEARFEKHVRVFTKQAVTYSELRGGAPKRKTRD